MYMGVYTGHYFINIAMGTLFLRLPTRSHLLTSDLIYASGWPGSGWLSTCVPSTGSSRMHRHIA